MSQSTSPAALTGAAGFSDSKKHYPVLDGLRGVAAIMVVLFHIMETFTGGDNHKQIINHGYLAVDFFFALSGFVIGYAYDDRWGKMTLGGFFKRRLIRLHPMIIAGMIIGAVLFFFQESPWMPAIAQTSTARMLLVMLIGFTLIPVPLSMDVRGWTEMHPLDGPAWSLFFEYIGNILYALIFRWVPKWFLALFVLLSAAALVHFAVFGPQGDVIGGWALEPQQLKIGFIRLLYPFFAGLLLSRVVKPGRIPHAFFWCSLLLIIIFAVPRIGGVDHKWMNGLYVAVSIIALFPLIVYMGASADEKKAQPSGIVRFLGDLSYPLYITHYPVIYCFTAWVSHHQELAKCSTTGDLMAVIGVALSVVVASVTIAWLCFRFYDVPVRKWLTKKWMVSGK